MKRKLITLLASCSLAIAIIIPVVAIQPVTDGNTQVLIQVMRHGAGGD